MQHDGIITQHLTFWGGFLTYFIDWVVSAFAIVNFHDLDNKAVVIERPGQRIQRVFVLTLKIFVIKIGCHLPCQCLRRRTLVLDRISQIAEGFIRARNFAAEVIQLPPFHLLQESTGLEKTPRKYIAAGVRCRQCDRSRPHHAIIAKGMGAVDCRILYDAYYDAYFVFMSS